jgi:hypothetical protein
MLEARRESQEKILTLVTKTGLSFWKRENAVGMTDIIAR